MAVVTTLAMNAGWLYGGTLIAGLIATVRKIRQMGRRQQARDTAARLSGGNKLAASAVGGRRTAGGPSGAARSTSDESDGRPGRPRPLGRG